MKSDSSSRSGLLLMEIIVAILFFSLTSAICLQLFVKTHHLSQSTRELDAAVRQADSVAAVLIQSQDPMKKLEELYPDSSADPEHREIYFNQDFQPCAREDSVYHLDILPSAADPRTVSYSVTMYNSESEKIYHLDVTAYHPYIP